MVGCGPIREAESLRLSLVVSLSNPVCFFEKKHFIAQDS